MKRPLVVLHVLFIVTALTSLCEGRKESAYLGVNYVKRRNNNIAPADLVSNLKSLNISGIKLYDSDTEILAELADSELSVVISAKNAEIPSLASSVLNADNWIRANVLAHYPSTKITTIVVGDDVFSDKAKKAQWNKVLPAMENLHSSLARWKLNRRIKVTTSMGMKVLDNFSLSSPSSTSFKPEITNHIRPILTFMSRSRSSYYANVYPYLQWKANPSNIPVDYAVLGKYKQPIADGSLQYNDVLSSQIDAHVYAMDKLGFEDVKITVGETGWPNEDTKLAATYNRRLIARALANPPLGTPKMPHVFIPTYIFSLFTTEKWNANWGLLHANGSEKMNIKASVSEFEYVKSIMPMPAYPYPGDAYAPQPSPNNPGQPGLPPLLPYNPPSRPRGHHHHHVISTPPPPLSFPPPSTTYPPPCMPYPTTPPPYVNIPSPPNPIVPPYTPAPGSSPPSQGQILWCVAKPTVPPTVLQKAMDYACGAGADCKEIQPSGPCFMPDTVISHASYAFNSYWQKHKDVGGSCDFEGTAMLITMDPSFEGCQFLAN